MAWQQQVPPQGPGVGGGYDPRFGRQHGMQLPQTGGTAAAPGVSNPFNDVLYGASSGILGTYLGNSKEYVQSNVCVSATPVHNNTCFSVDHARGEEYSIGIMVSLAFVPLLSGNLFDNLWW
jgi:hypothetical protein